MSDEEHDLAARARRALVEDARAWKRHRLGSIREWEERAEGSEAAAVVSPRELRAVVNVVWGLG